MGIVNSGILKGVTGKIGNIVVYERDGKTIVRNSSGKEKGVTPKELLNQQSRIKSSAFLFSKIKENNMLETAWRIGARHRKVKSGYHLFNKLNTKAFNQDYVIGDFSRLTLCAGTIELPFNIEQVHEPGMISIVWEPVNIREDMHDTLRFKFVVMYDHDPFNFEVIDTNFTMGDCSARVKLMNELAKTAHIYCFFADPSGSEFTDSVYFKVCL